MKANNVRCGGGERNKAAGHPGDGNGDGDRRQALGGWWRCIRWRRKWDFAVDLDTYSAMGECNFSDYSKLAQKLSYFFSRFILGERFWEGCGGGMRYGS